MDLVENKRVFAFNKKKQQCKPEPKQEAKESLLDRYGVTNEEFLEMKKVYETLRAQYQQFQGTVGPSYQYQYVPMTGNNSITYTTTSTPTIGNYGVLPITKLYSVISEPNV